MLQKITLFVLISLSCICESFSQEANLSMIREKLNVITLERNKLATSPKKEEYIRLTWQMAEAHQQLALDGVAVQLYEEAILEAQKMNNKKILADAFRRLGDFYPTLKFYRKAKNNYLQATELYKMTDEWTNYKETTYKTGKAAYDVHDYSSANTILSDLLDYSTQKTYQLDYDLKKEVLTMLFKSHQKQRSRSKAQFYATLLRNLESSKTGNKDLQKELAQYLKIDRGMLSQKEAQRLQKQIEELEKGLKLSHLMNLKKNDTINTQQDLLEVQKREIELQKELVLLKEREKKMEQERLEERNKNNIILASSILSVVLLSAIAIIIVIQRSKHKLAIKNILIESQKSIIEIEKEKSETLLLNILPEQTARELKENGVTEPRFYEKVSVLFTDFKGFTQISEKLSPQEIIAELNFCFLMFDEIVEKYNLEKIKTIGDAYMCAGGVPTANESNPIDAVRAGLEMQLFMQKWKAEKIAKGEPYFELRLGIHTGALVAGVIGKKKFAYDIWGDTVNLAARMEASGEIGKVNISGETFKFVENHFNCVHRGKIPAKNKGEVDMYFVQE